MTFIIRAIVPIDKKDTLDAVQALTKRLGHASKKHFGYFASIKFGNSASLRERLAVSRKGSSYRRIWELDKAEQFMKLFGSNNDITTERINKDDITTIGSVSAFVLSAPANDFTLVALDVIWDQSGVSLTSPYNAFQGVRSCLEEILWQQERRGLPEIPGFMLLNESNANYQTSEGDVPDIVSLSQPRERLKAETYIPTLNSIINGIPQIRQVHQIRNFRNASLYMVPIIFAQGQGLHTWAFCSIGMSEMPNFMPPGDDLQPATTAWEFESLTAWQFLCILRYWLSQSIFTLAQLREQTLTVVKQHTYQQESAEYRELLRKQSELSQRLLILNNLEDWVPDLSARAQGFLNSSNRTSLREEWPRRAGETQEESDLAMQIPLDISESLRDLSDMTKTLQAHVGEYVAVATMKQQYELMEQGRRTNQIIIWLTIAVLVLAVAQAAPSLRNWVTQNASTKNVEQQRGRSDIPPIKRTTSKMTEMKLD